MTIAAKYENGVFKPLERVTLEEGTRVDVYVPANDPQAPPKSLRELRAFGMWADRAEFKDGIDYEDNIRKPRY